MTSWPMLVWFAWMPLVVLSHELALFGLWVTALGVILLWRQG